MAFCSLNPIHSTIRLKLRHLLKAKTKHKPPFQFKNTTHTLALNFGQILTTEGAGNSSDANVITTPLLRSAPTEPLLRPPHASGSEGIQAQAHAIGARRL